MKSKKNEGRRNVVKVYKPINPPEEITVQICGGCGILLDGSEEHDVDCPNLVEEEKPRPQIWDGKSIAGGTFERGE